MGTRPITVTVLAYLLSLSVLLTGCAKKEPSPFTRIPTEALDKSQQQMAERVAFRTMTAWRKGRFEPLSNDFTQQMKSALDSRQQRGAYASIAGLFGEFKSLKFVEAVETPQFPNMVIYRFRGRFSVTKDKPEIRVVVNAHGKIAGFWCRPWNDTVQ